MHIIRLRGPWQLEPIECYGHGADSLPAATTATMPVDWAEALGADFRGVVRYRRTFRWPAQLLPEEQVWLVIDPPRSAAVVWLNEHELGMVQSDQTAGRFDITTLIAAKNLLLIEVAHPPLDMPADDQENSINDQPGGLVGEVRLEIETISSH